MSDGARGEQPAVRTTIVGGRPPGSGKGIGAIPRGIEVLVKKASVDAEFRALLLERRAAAASEIGLELEPAEAMMLDGVPPAQLEAIIASTKVDEANRRAFLGRAAALMLAALGVGAAGCQKPPPPKGIAPDKPPVTDGSRPDRPLTAGDRPDAPAATREPVAPEGLPQPEAPQEIAGARPDVPPQPEPAQPAPPKPPAPTGIRPDRP